MSQRFDTAAAILLVLLFLPAGAARAGGPDPAAGPAGIDCSGRQKSGIGFSQLNQAEAKRDWPAAIGLLRGAIADQRCANAYLLIKLAVDYARAGKAAEAFEVADYGLEHFPNPVAANLEASGEPAEEQSLNELRALPGFGESLFARRLAERYAEREKRLAAARQALAALPVASRPPSPFIAEGACPFECCTFREWTVEQPIELYAAPAGAPLGRKLSPGGKVLGLTGEVHLEPRPMRAGIGFEADASFDSDEKVKIPAGALVFQLDHLGEGFARFWYGGKTFVAELTQCIAFGPDCWGEALDPGAPPPVHQWWVKVRLSDGTEAWARDEGFGNMDSCG